VLNVITSEDRVEIIQLITARWRSEFTYPAWGIVINIGSDCLQALRVGFTTIRVKWVKERVCTPARLEILNLDIGTGTLHAVA
jgi:hypothetical protein